MYRSKPSKNQTQSEMDGKICQNIKPPTPTHIPSSVQLSTWGNEKIRLQTVFILFVIL